jgi:hypothetical protein
MIRIDERRLRNHGGCASESVWRHSSQVDVPIHIAVLHNDANPLRGR